MVVVAFQATLNPTLAEHLDQMDILLRLVLTTVEAQGGTNERVDQLDQSLAERSGQTDELLRQLLARVEAQGGTDQLTERLNKAFVQRSDRTESLLREVLHEARAQPGAEHLLARVRWATADGSDTNAALLRRILATLKDQPALAEQVRDLRTLIEEQPAQTQVALAQIITAIPTKADYEALLSAIADVKSTFPDTADVNTGIDQVLTLLNAQATVDQIAAAVKVVTDSEPDRGAKRLEQVVAMLDTKPSTEQILSAIKRIAEVYQGQLVEKLDQLATEIQVALEGDLHARQTAEMKLEEIQQLIGDWPQQTDARLAEVVAAVRGSVGPEAAEAPGEPVARGGGAGAEVSSPVDEMFAQVLREIRTRAIAGLDELRATIRSELQAGLQQSRIAAAPAPSAAGAGSSADPTATDVSVRRRGARPGRERRSVLLGPQARETRHAGAEGDRSEPPLTRTERAYKLAFETGHPVPVGAGVINPTTGEVTEGRTLDPALARAAGIKTWRDWYLMDDFSERMRLHNQAMRFVGDHGSPAGVISLPPPPPGKTPEAGAEPHPEQ